MATTTVEAAAAASDGVDRLLMKLRLRDDVSELEEAALRAVIQPPVRVASRSVVVREGCVLERSALVVDGMLARAKDLRDGQRQITELHIAGDFADLHTLTLKRLDQNIVALGDCWISWASHSDLCRITAELPHLARMLWLSTNLDAAIHRAWTVSLGRRDALARLAHLLCEFQVRLAVVGLADDQGYDLSLTQIDLAECLGLTSVHVNRVVRELRERGLATVRGGQVRIEDGDQLRRLAEFSPDYLFLEKRPR